MQSASRGYHLWRQFYAPNPYCNVRRCCPLRDTQETKSTDRILPRAISEMSLRGSRGVANIRRFVFASGISHLRSLTFHLSCGMRTSFETVCLRAAWFFQCSIDVAGANEPEFFRINWISHPFREPVEHALSWFNKRSRESEEK